MTGSTPISEPPHPWKPELVDALTSAVRNAGYDIERIAVVIDDGKARASLVLKEKGEE